MTKHADYLSEIFDVDRLCENADQHLKPQMHKFEMLVGTGVSGTLMAGILATHLGCDFGIVRKPNVNTHSNNDVEPGNPDPRCRWLFVDDLICSGQTRVYVRTMMAGEGYHNFVGTYLASSKGTLLMGEAEVDRVPPIPVKDKLRSRPQEFYGESPVQIVFDKLTTGPDWDKFTDGLQRLRNADFGSEVKIGETWRPIPRSKPL